MPDTSADKAWRQPCVSSYDAVMCAQGLQLHDQRTSWQEYGQPQVQDTCCLQACRRGIPKASRSAHTPQCAPVVTDERRKHAASAWSATASKGTDRAPASSFAVPTSAIDQST